MADQMAHRGLDRGAGRGFTLVEAAVAVAVVAILAGMMAPMALKVLNQRREEATRRDLKLAWEALFGSRERRVMNMASDFGFVPRRTQESLPLMVQGDGVPPMGNHDGSSFRWGYNGPYWLGETGRPRDGEGGGLMVPVDAWGSPIGLVTAGAFTPLQPQPTLTFQLRSLGADRRVSEDDLFYPSVPVPITALFCHVLVTVATTAPGLEGLVTVRYPSYVGRRPAPTLFTTTARILPGATLQALPFMVQTGAFELVVEPAGKSTFRRLVLPMDLLPGETREVRLTL